MSLLYEAAEKGEEKERRKKKEERKNTSENNGIPSSVWRTQHGRTKNGDVSGLFFNESFQKISRVSGTSSME